MVESSGLLIQRKKFVCDCMCAYISINSYLYAYIAIFCGSCVLQMFPLYDMSPCLYIFVCVRVCKIKKKKKKFLTPSQFLQESHKPEKQTDTV